jgi:hypothetical protein
MPSELIQEFAEWFMSRNQEEHDKRWVDGEAMSPEGLTFEEWFYEMLAEETDIYASRMCTEECDLMLREFGLAEAYMSYAEHNGMKDVTDDKIYTHVLYMMTTDYSQELMEEMEEAMKHMKDEDEEETWFNEKYPNASCHRCDEKLNGHTVVYCGGHGGACETWYCKDCHNDGTDDCACHEDESDNEDA